METQFVAALSAGQWVAVVGFVLMGIIYLARKLLVRLVPKSELDLVAAAVAVLSGVAAALLVGANDSWQEVAARVLTALATGAAAVGFWELLGARLERWYLARKQ